MTPAPSIFHCPSGLDIAHVHHLGLATLSIQKTLEKIPNIDPKLVPIFIDKGNDVKVAFVEIFGIPYEFVEPMSDTSPVSKQLRDQKMTQPYHVCIMPNIGVTGQLVSDRLVQSGFSKLSKVLPAVAFAPMCIQWFVSPVFGLLELILDE